MKTCFKLSCKCTNVRNDHVVVSESFYRPSLNYSRGHCPIAIGALPYSIGDTEIIILFIKII